MSVHFASQRSGAGCGSWLRYFAAALCMGGVSAQDQPLLNYWWVYEDELPAVQNDTTRVIRVIGEKGEKYEEVSDEAYWTPMMREARAERERILREEAVALAQQYIEDGKPMAVAYELAWATVYRRHWLKRDFSSSGSDLEALLARLADTDSEQQFTESELRWALQELLADARYMETDDGRALLEHIANRLRAMSGTSRVGSIGRNDELMERFVDALQHDFDAFSAYRDALFKTYRDRIVKHELVGYRAPWGAGMGGRVRYRQAPRKVTRTVGSGTSGVKNQPVEEEETLEENKKKTTAQDDESAASSSSMPGAGEGGSTFSLSPMRFSMARAAAEPLALNPGYTEVTDTAAFYFTDNNGTKASGNTTITRTGQNKNNYKYTTKTPGSYNGTSTSWTSISNSKGTGTATYWKGSSALGGFSRNTATAAGGVTDTITGIEIGQGDKLYIGGSKNLYGGTIYVVPKTTTAYIGSYLPQGTLFNMGKLAGSGAVTFLAHGASNQASIYSFNDAGVSSSDWFSGTVNLGASQGGIIELDLGAKGDSSAWANVVFDMTPAKGPGHSTSTGTDASQTILNLRNDITIAGLEGGNGNSTVTSQSAAVGPAGPGQNQVSNAFYNLTLGSENADADYVYSGTFNGRYYTSATASQASTSSIDLIKVGNNQQTITQSITKDANRLHSIEVQGGELRFDADEKVKDKTYDDDIYDQSVTVRYASVSGGRLLASNLYVFGEEVDAPSLNITGGELHVNNSIIVSPNLINQEEISSEGTMGVSGGAKVTAAHVLVDKALEVSGAGTRLTVSGKTEHDVEKSGWINAGSMAITAGAHVVAENVNVINWLEIGQGGTTAGTPTLTVSGDLEAGQLRLRSNGLLETGDSAISLNSAHLHGGATWKLQGSHNQLLNEMVLEDIFVNGDGIHLTSANTVKRDAGNPATIPSDSPVLTLPKMINVSGGNWTNPDTPLFELSGVTLDFCEDVIISGLTFQLKEDHDNPQVITLASTDAVAGGWFKDSSYTDTGVASVRFSQGGYLWHGALSYDENNNIVATILHKTEQPLILESGSLTYIEMRQNATAPALPHLAYTDGKWSNGWTGKEVLSANLLKFSNVQLADGANLYLGEDLTVVYDANDPTKVVADYRPDRNFGGKITVNPGDAPAYLHGQIADWGKWTLHGQLAGGGELVLVAHNGSAASNNDNNRASSFVFTSTATPEDWFDGTLYIDDPTGGIVQLHVGNVNIAEQGDTRWRDTLIDLSHTDMKDAATGATDTGERATHVLVVEGDTTLRGLRGTDEHATVVSTQREQGNLPSVQLTLGADNSGPYTYAGIIGKGTYYQGGDADAAAQTNCYTTRTGSLNLTKIGTNIQAFSGSAYLDAVEVQGGRLVFSGVADVNFITVRDGATLQTGKNLTADVITLEGGATWLSESSISQTNTADSLTTIYLTDIFQDGVVHSITIGSATNTPITWEPAQNMGMAAAGTWFDNADAIFKIEATESGTPSVTLQIGSKPRVIAGLNGVTAGSMVALYSGVAEGAYTSLGGKDNLVMVEDGKGNFYDAWYVQTGDTIYLKLDDKMGDYGIVVPKPPLELSTITGYIWSGEQNGTTVPNDVHYINMTLGNIWKADDAYNTGWHEQRAEGSAVTDIGKYVNGNAVYFLDVNVHGWEELGYRDYTVSEAEGEYAAERKVDIRGNVAPGHIFVDADHNLGFVDGSAGAKMQYAYAFVSNDNTGCITDIDGDNPTSITKTGKGLLVLNLRNTFSGGIDVQDGGLYLAAEGAAGTGTLTFHTDEVWSQKVVGTGDVLSVDQERTGAELMICYPFSDDAVSAFRLSEVANDIVLTSSNNDQGGFFTITFAYASFNSDSGGDHSNLPRHWRNVSFSGALIGAGYETTDASGNTSWVNTSKADTIVLTGYSSTWSNADDQSYVTVLTLNEDSVEDADKNGIGDAYRYVTTSTGAKQVVNRFQGTVVMKNTINTSPLDSNRLWREENGKIVDRRTAGTVQVTLKGDKLVEAHLDMTREDVLSSYDEGYDGNNDGVKDHRQTYNNILVLNGNANIRGLSADFLGSGWDYKESSATSGTTSRVFEDVLPQNDEVWHVRVLTAGENTLQLGTYGDTANTETYVYSGAMGFAQAYTGTSQGHIPWGDGFFNHTNPDWKYGGHEMGTETLNLVKSSASTQFIHTALLDDVSLYEGTLGFNNLQLKGNLNLAGKTTLILGATGQIDDKNTWNKIDENSSSVMSSTYEKRLTSDTVTVGAGKTLTVITQSTQMRGDKEVPTTAFVKGMGDDSQGHVTMEADSTLTFRTNDILPYALQAEASTGENGDVILTWPKTAEYEASIVPLLDIDGTLTINDLDKLTVTLTGTNFSVDAFSNKKYYLAAADAITIITTETVTNWWGTTNETVANDETAFGSRTISLGYGYFGTLYTVGTAGSSINDGDYAVNRDYLVMSITGDPRRTWSGNLTSSSKEHPAHAWFDTPTAPPDNVYDYRWKENKAFQEGLVVLFGNLYEPVEWTETSELNSDQTVRVKADQLNTGTTVLDVAGEYNFAIDRHSLETTYTDAQKAAAEEAGINLDYQAVRVDGNVAPFSIILNSEYYKYAQDGEGNYTVLVLNEDGGSLHEDNTNYYFYTTGELKVNDDGDVISDTRGRIVDADPGILEKHNFDGAWKTMLHKSGSGTTVMALDNSYSGGSILQGGRLVMQHENALGTGTITLMNGALLQGDFLDDNLDDSANNYLGKAMDTTTIHNHVVVNVYADPENPDYNAIIDGRIANSYDKKLVLTTLAGEADTVLQLNGVGLSAAKSKELYGRDDMYRYGVFKVLDPSGFRGTVTMVGHEWGAEGLNAAVPGRVQLDIMSTTKSDDGADWTSATIDLSVNEGTERTVLALDATGEVDPDPDKGYEWCVLDSITGSINTAGGTSSVLNISAHNPVTLVLKGMRDGDYHGVMGYGDFQVAVNYGGYDEELQGSEQHHYGAKGYGSLNLIKQGAGKTQHVRRAWLNQVEIQGGDFHVEEALVASSLKAGGGTRIMVGGEHVHSLYALTVGAGGVLAMNTDFDVSGTKQDAWAGITAGTTAGDTTNKAGWVLLENGSTLSARQDWYTRKQVDIATGAHVTINTHNFTIDPYILTDECKDEKFLAQREYSHIIQLLGKVSGSNVNLTLNNWKTDPSDKNNPDAELRNEVSRDIGYVALNDLNDFSGSSRVTVEDMTVLQILNHNGGVKSDVDITVAGKNATLQILDQVTSYESSDSPVRSNKMVQYIDELTLGADSGDASSDPYKRENNGQLLLGGMEQTTLTQSNQRLTAPDLAGMQVTVTSRHDGSGNQGKVNYLNVDMTGTAVNMGGTTTQKAQFINTHVDMENMQVAHKVHHAEVTNSLIHLQKMASVNLADVVTVDARSSVHGGYVVDANDITPDDPCIVRGVTGLIESGGPVRAAEVGSSTHLNEVSTSVSTHVHMTFADFKNNDPNNNVFQAGDSKILVLMTEQFKGVDVSGNGLTIQLQVDNWVSLSHQTGAEYIAIQMGGGTGQFHYEVDLSNFGRLLDSQFVLRDSHGNQMTGMWVTATDVWTATGQEVSPHMLYFMIPEPATATLSLLALAALCARRRRKA